MRKGTQINGFLSPYLQKKRFEKAAPFLKGKRFLDIGCSHGEITRYLLEDCEYIGIEGNKSYFEAAKEQNSKSRFINLYLDEENVGSLDVGGKVDVIIALAIIEHLKNPKKVLAGLKKYLKNDGRI